MSSVLSERVPLRTRWSELLFWTVGVGAALWYLACLSNEQFSLFHNAYSIDAAYNYYFLSLLDGRFDVPLRTIAYEGHYLPDGRAFVYYGLAPALIRGFFAPFVDLSRVSVAPAVVWVLATATGFVCQSSLLYVVRRGRVASLRLELLVLVSGALAIWFSSPLTALAGSAPIYHEPILFAFLLTMLFLRLCLPILYGEASPRDRLVPLALLASLAVHARPHVAATLYMVTCGLMIMHWLSVKRDASGHRRGSLPRQGGRATLGALAILGASGLIYLGVNKVRFDDGFTYHGGSHGPVVQGTVYLGMEAPDSPRWRGFSEHGRFNVRRIIPNASYYLLSDKKLHADLTSWFETGFVRLEPPMRSVVEIWAPWLVMLVAGLGLFSAGIRREQRIRPWASPGLALLLLAASLILHFTMLSYATVTLRYTTELFVFVFFGAILSLGLLLPLAEQLGRGRGAALLSTALVTLALSLNASSQLGVEYRKKFRDGDRFFFEYDFCIKALSRHVESAEAIEGMCRVPERRKQP